MATKPCPGGTFRLRVDRYDGEAGRGFDVVQESNRLTVTDPASKKRPRLAQDEIGGDEGFGPISPEGNGFVMMLIPSKSIRDPE
jgi:hypothetical protein